MNEKQHMDKVDTKKKKRTLRSKRAFLEALKETMGIITTACNRVNIGRATVYKWLKENPEFAAEVDDITNIAKDYVEGKLLENIKSNDVASIIFYLKTKAKDRGYSERQEIVHDLTKLPIRFNLILPKDED